MNLVKNKPILYTLYFAVVSFLYENAHLIVFLYSGGQWGTKWML